MQRSSARSGVILTPESSGRRVSAGVVLPSVAKTLPIERREIPQSIVLVAPLLVLCMLASVSAVMTGVWSISSAREEASPAMTATLGWTDLIEQDVSLDGTSEYFSLAARTRREEREFQQKVEEASLQPKVVPASALHSQVLAIIQTNNRRQTQARKLASLIVEECQQSGYDPLFVAAVIKSESAFNEFAVSHVGATGLMQIMPATGRYLRKYTDSTEYPVAAKLTDAKYNIHLGVTYLKQLEDMYDGNRLLTLIAYNWGPGKLDRAIRSGRGVPAEVMRYALKILRDHNLWQRTAVA